MIPAHTAQSAVDSRSKPFVTDFTIRIPGSNARPEVEPQPSRWGTREFKFYYVAFAMVVPVMIWIPVQLSYGEFQPDYFDLLLGRYTSMPHVEEERTIQREALKSG
jgi:hypothetical protein